MADHGHNGAAAAAMPASDGSAAPAPFELPELFFKARCAAPNCRALLGGFHVPSVGGMVVFSCAHCARTTVFKVEQFQIRSALVGPMTGTRMCPPTSVRKRQGKG